jgi:hypothetical protein
MFLSSFVFIFDLGRDLCWSFDDFLGFAIPSAENHSVFVFYPKPISSTNISLYAHKSVFAPIFPSRGVPGRIIQTLLGRNIRAKLRLDNPALRSVHIKRGASG